MMRTVRFVGAGRAGTALAWALSATNRWSVDGLLRRVDDVRAAAAGADLLVLSVPDPAIADVAVAVEPDDGCVVAHMAGSLGLDVLAPHARRAVLHPLASLTGGESGGGRLWGAWWGLAVGADPIDEVVVADLDGHPLRIADADRTRYHAAAAIAANHLVALLGQVERVAATIDVPLAAYLPLAQGAVRNVAELGPAAALTGPVARGDEATIARHLAALPAEERSGYEAMVREARKLAR